jgi:hypothetical protein
MKRKIILVTLILSAATFLYADLTSASSMRRGPFLVKQPDGSSFLAKGYGDEFLSWYETLDG